MNATSFSPEEREFDLELFAAYMTLILVFVAIIIKSVLLAWWNQGQSECMSSRESFGLEVLPGTRKNARKRVRNLNDTASSYIGPFALNTQKYTICIHNLLSTINITVEPQTSVNTWSKYMESSIRHFRELLDLAICHSLTS